MASQPIYEMYAEDTKLKWVLEYTEDKLFV